MVFCRFHAFFRRMAASAPVVLAPVGVRGMKVLEREKFSRKIQVPVLKVKGENLSKISTLCKTYFLKLEQFKPVQNAEDVEFKKYIYFSPEIITTWVDMAQDVRSSLYKEGIAEDNFTYKDIDIGYNNWSYDVIFTAVLPENAETVSGFSQIGHIIHLNLRDKLLEYRSLIGQVLLDKIKTCRTVVYKSNIIDNTYRNFNMEVIAGEEEFITNVKENNCRFEFDFRNVYWNPRLGKEHERILNYLKPRDILFDVFSGVGPFSVPAAKQKQCRVFANDLNPDSYKWLKLNAEKNNKLKKDLLKCYNMDGKEFISVVFRDFITEYCKGNEKIENGSKIHITMNLPAMAVEFLKYFNGLIKDEKLMTKFNCDIIVYVYCFVGEDGIQEAKKMIKENFGCDMESYILDVFNVRKVSPKKEMMRVTIKLTKEILFVASNENDEPAVKKRYIENND